MPADKLSSGFPPIEPAEARILLLGSLPGQASIRAGQYYAHPRNAFWPIMEALVGAKGSYDERCAGLASRGIAVWDVLQQSERPGSLDSAIRIDTAKPNDFEGFLRRHPGLTLIGFNGRKSQLLFTRLVDVSLPESVATMLLPSTSPAYASMTLEAKLGAWRGIISSHI